MSGVTRWWSCAVGAVVFVGVLGSFGPRALAFAATFASAWGQGLLVGLVLAPLLPRATVSSRG